MYEYLIGCIILFVIWIILVYIRKDLLSPSIWTGAVYLIFNTIIFFSWFFVSKYIYLGDPIVPSYWHPNTLFDINAKTGGYGIEDALFMFLVGGVATVIYELMSHQRIQIKKSYKPHVKAFIVLLVSILIFVHTVHVNLIWSMIFGTFMGALTVCLERRDLIKHSLYGGLAFLMLYFAAFSLFNVIFPYFIPTYYTLHNLSGIMILHLPLEEYLYAFTFGMMWAPLYEYFHGERNK